jgi:hypothetical protein
MAQLLFFSPFWLLKSKLKIKRHVIASQLHNTGDQKNS